MGGPSLRVLSNIFIRAQQIPLCVNKILIKSKIYNSGGIFPIQSPLDHLPSQLVKIVNGEDIIKIIQGASRIQGRFLIININ